MTRRVLTVAAVASLALGSLASLANAASYKLDPPHSSIAFKIKHTNASWVYGLFSSPTGTVDLNDDGTGSIDISVKTETVNTGVAARDTHLKSNDFFGAKEFPTISFKSTKITKSGDGYEVTGDLSLHGVTKSITLTLTASEEQKGMKGPVRGFDTTFTINRTDFGVGKSMPGMLDDNVTLMISLQGGKQ